MNQKKDAALVIFSGGQDSTTALLYAKDRFEQCLAVSFDYGQRHKKELEVASALANALAIPHEIIEVPVVGALVTSSLTSPTQTVPKGIAEGIPSTFVPGRNALFSLMGAMYAFERQVFNLVLGACEVDFSGYPDCRSAFFTSMQQTVSLAFGQRFDILTPLMHLSKSEIWAAADAKSALDLIKTCTLTCYNGKVGSGCGTCAACLLRSQGLAEYEKNPRKYQQSMQSKLTWEHAESFITAS